MKQTRATAWGGRSAGSAGKERSKPLILIREGARFMGKPYSQELREAIIKAVAGGCTLEQAAKDHEVSVSTVTRLLRRSRATGNCRPDKFGGHKPHALEPHEEQVRRLVREQPEITLKQMQARLLKQGIDVSKSSIARFFDHLDPEEAAGRRVCRNFGFRLLRRRWLVDESASDGVRDAKSEEWST